jgi:uncharacterized protein
MKDESNTEQISQSFSPAPAADPIKKKRGFAVMDPTQVRELGRRGGVSAHVLGKAHEFSSDEARAAGRKGGLASNAARKPSLVLEAVPSLTPDRSLS